jgi:CheY-like chemotaxis protein
MQLQPRLAGSAVGYVVADAAILKQVLVQLLCCAVQEALTAPEVEVRLEDDSASIVVTFSGGLDAVRDRRVADAQRIALSQGMACDVESASGTTSLRLRLARGRPVTVLVVEDNPGAVELYRRYLSPRGWQVQSVSDPRQAVEAAREARPDVILLDIMMPRLDGWSVLQALRTQGETASTPVVVCSIVEQPELAASLGASACLTKPVSQGELVSTLSRCLAGVGR